MIQPILLVRLSDGNVVSRGSISLRFGTELDHATADAVQLFKVKSSKVNVT